MISILQLVLVAVLILSAKTDCYRELNDIIFTKMECKDGYYLSESTFYEKTCCSLDLFEGTGALLDEGTLFRFTKADPIAYALVLDQTLRPFSPEQIPYMFSNPMYFDVFADFTEDIKNIIYKMTGYETRRAMPMIFHLNTDTPIGTFSMQCEGFGEGPGSFIWDYEDTDPSSTSSQLVRRRFMDHELFDELGFKKEDSVLQPNTYCGLGKLGCPVTLTADYSDNLNGKRIQFVTDTGEQLPGYYWVIDNSIRKLASKERIEYMFANYWLNFLYTPIEYKTCFVEKRDILDGDDNIFICAGNGHIRLRDWAFTEKGDTTSYMVKRWVVHTEVFDRMALNWEHVKHYEDDSDSCLLSDGDELGRELCIETCNREVG